MLQNGKDRVGNGVEGVKTGDGPNNARDVYNDLSDGELRASPVAAEV